MPHLNERALNAQDVADILQVSRNTVYNLVKAGDLSSYMVGRKMRFTRADVDAYIARNHADAVMSATVSGTYESERPVFRIAGNDMLADVVANYVGQQGVKVVRVYENSYTALERTYTQHAEAAVIHLFDRKTGRFNVPFVQRLMPGTPVVVFHLARRQAGLIVRKRNPKRLSKWADLLRKDVTVALPEPGCGARVLTDECLVALGAPVALFEKRVECSNVLAAAHFVAAGEADCTVGTQRATSAVEGLSFVPLTWEDVALVVRKDEKHADVLRTLRAYVPSPAFASVASALAGHDTTGAGNILYEV